jgi:hypothetical protein
MSLDVTAGNAALRIRYAKGLSRILFDDPKLTPFASQIVRKKGKLVAGAFGQKFVVPIKYNDPQTAAADYATGYAAAATAYGQSRYVAFEVLPVLGYSHARVTGPAIVQSEDKTSAFVDLGSEELDGQLRVLQRKMAVTAFGTGFGDRAKISAVSATTVTLTNKEDIIKFEVDQLLVAAASPAADVLKATFKTTGNRITAKNAATGVLTVAGDATATWAANDYIFILSERQDSATPVKANWWGVSGWLPTVAPTAGDSWGNVDRSTDPKLHGYRYDASGDGNIRDGLIKASAFMFNNTGSMANPVCWMNPIDFARATIQLEAAGSKLYTQQGINAKISFSQIDVFGLSGKFPLAPDPTCPKGTAYLLDMDTWYVIYSGDDFVHVMSEDGLVYRNVAGADTWHASARTMSNMVCDAPGDNLVILGLP